MRIAFVHGGFSSVGGIESFARDLVCALRDRDVLVELICWNASHEMNPLLGEISTAGVPVHRSQWRWGCRWGLPDEIMARQERKRLADADLLVFGKMLKESIHRRLHGLAKRMILVTPYRPREMWQEKRPEAGTLNWFDSIVVQAPSFEEDLRFFGYRGKVVTLPYLPPEASAPANWPAGEILQIGYLGRLVPDKNVEYLIESFSQLRAMGLEAELHLFGDGPERRRLESLTYQMGLVRWVCFHGKKDRSEIAAAIDQCHLFAFSSRTEGQCLAALEVLARGRPVVATPVGAFPDLLRGMHGGIAPPENPGVFARALMAAANPILAGRTTPADVQRGYLRRFDRERVINGYMKLFGSYDGVAHQKAGIA